MIRWAETVLHLSLGQAALVQCFLAVGVVAGSLGVAHWIDSAGSFRVLPAGIIVGLCVILVSQVSQLWIACVVLGVTGVAAGIIMVPMNALLQQRGSALMPPGASIALQGFSENLASLIFLAVYGALLALDVPVRTIIVCFGLLVIALVMMIARRNSHRIRVSA